jgi:hypothetical protein
MKTVKFQLWICLWNVSYKYCPIPHASHKYSQIGLSGVRALPLGCSQRERETSDMTSEGLGEMFLGDSAEMCGGNFLLMSMGGRVTVKRAQTVSKDTNRHERIFQLFLVQKISSTKTVIFQQFIFLYFPKINTVIFQRFIFLCWQLQFICAALACYKYHQIPTVVSNHIQTLYLS